MLAVVKPLLTLSPTLVLASRRYSTKINTKQYSLSHIVPYQFSIREAAQRFVLSDKERYLSPTTPYLPRALEPYLPDSCNSHEILDSKSLALSTQNPLKRVCLPLYVADFHVINIKYQVRYGINHQTVRYDSKGNPYIYYYTDYYFLNRSLPSHYFNSITGKACLYAGYTYPVSDVEEVVSKLNIFEHAVPYDSNYIEESTIVDPFLMRSETARHKLLTRLKSSLREAIIADTNRQVRCDHISIQSIDYEIAKSQISTVLFPSYILQYGQSPAQIMAAIRHAEKISGMPTISSKKVMMASIVPSIILGLAVPGSLAFRAVVTATTVALSGTFSSWTPWVKYRSEKYLLEREKKHNGAIDESKDDQARREETESFISYDDVEPKMGADQVIYDIDPINFQVLGLSPCDPIDEEIVVTAFLTEIRKCHPDVIRSLSLSVEDRNRLEERAVQVTRARDVILKTIRSS